MMRLAIIVLLSRQNLAAGYGSVQCCFWIWFSNILKFQLISPKEAAYDWVTKNQPEIDYIVYNIIDTRQKQKYNSNPDMPF